jgi:hypothetical protein
MFFLFLFLGLVFIIGGCLAFIGLVSKNHRSLIKTGFIFCIVPIGLLLITWFFAQVLNSFKHKPTLAELVGEYHITEVTNLNFDKSTYDQYILKFESDSTFTLTPTPYIDVCDSGKYEVDYSFENNEIAYRCGKGYISGHIDRQFGDFRIEFIIGDPDSDQSIYFGKVNRESK